MIPGEAFVASSNLALLLPFVSVVEVLALCYHSNIRSSFSGPASMNLRCSQPDNPGIGTCRASPLSSMGMPVKVKNPSDVNFPRGVQPVISRKRGITEFKMSAIKGLPKASDVGRHLFQQEYCNLMVKVTAAF